MLQKIKTLASNYSQEFILIRHHLHAHPELSYQEFETSAFIQQKLSSYDITSTVLATTGVVGIIEGKNPSSKITALRADMEKGVTPVTVSAQPSEKALNVEVFLAGYRRFKQSVTLKPNEAATVSAGTLVAESGGIEFRLAGAEFRLPQAKVMIDGQPVTLTKGMVNGLEVGP